MKQTTRGRKKLNDHIASYTKLINQLPGETKLISTNWLPKDLINGYSILIGAKYFSKEDGSQNHSAFQPVYKYFKPIKLCQMKALNLLLHQVIVVIQDWIILIISNFEKN